MRARPAGGSGRILSAGEVLFREGDPRSHIYRVERGAICLSRQRPDGTREVLEFAFPGDLVGLGYQDHHVASAQATMHTALLCLPRSAVEQLDDASESGVHLTPAIEGQSRNVAARPLVRIAALLVTLARCNAYEGRDPTIIADSLSCGVVAGYLNMSVDALAQVLGELKKLGLVAASDRGLQLTNLHELERLADTPD